MIPALEGHPRLTPARGDIAAASLRGRVAAERYVEGRPAVVVAAAADLRRHPRPDAAVDTQAIHGEAVTVFEEDEGWGWVQLAADGYVGYLPLQALGEPGAAPTHVVAANRTFVYPAADMKQPVLAALPLGAQLAIRGTQGAFAQLAGGGFVVSRHLAARDAAAPDFVAIAEQLLETPYLWGGRSPLGIDCSGLVQAALARAGIAAPRDTGMQEAALGDAVAADSAGLRRGDLVFWRGHVAIMTDPTTCIHANAHHMLVACEAFAPAVARIAANGGGAVSSVRRLVM